LIYLRKIKVPVFFLQLKPSTIFAKTKQVLLSFANFYQEESRTFLIFQRLLLQIEIIFQGGVERNLISKVTAIQINIVFNYTFLAVTAAKTDNIYAGNIINKFKSKLVSHNTRHHGSVL